MKWHLGAITLVTCSKSRNWAGADAHRMGYYDSGRPHQFLGGKTPGVTEKTLNSPSKISEPLHILLINAQSHTGMDRCGLPRHPKPQPKGPARSGWQERAVTSNYSSSMIRRRE